MRIGYVRGGVKNILQKPKKYLGFMIEIKSEPLYNYQRKHGQASQTVTQYHQLTRTHKVLGAKQHGITVSSSFEIQPVFLHSSSLFCHTLWLLKLEDP